MTGYMQYVQTQDAEQLEYLIAAATERLDSLRQRKWLTLWVVGDLVNKGFFKYDEYATAFEFLGMLVKENASRGLTYEISINEVMSRIDEAKLLLRGSELAYKKLKSIYGTENAIDPVEGDLLPVVGSTVSIHLNSPDKWVNHTVVGYYVWSDLKGNTSLNRVFVRVKDDQGYLNARMLCDVNPKIC